MFLRNEGNGRFVDETELHGFFGLEAAFNVAIRTLRGAGISLSDRRAVKVQRLAAAAAVLAGRAEPTEADLWPLLYAVPSEEGQRLARTRLRDLLARTENPTLPAAAEEASLGPLARATRLVAAGTALLGAPTAERGGPWRLKLEGVAREIDAGFAAGSRPAELESVRTRIVGALSK